jgi:hypothetical protein
MPEGSDAASQLTPRISCRAAARLTGVWGTLAGGTGPYTIHWPRPANFMRLLGAIESAHEPGDKSPTNTPQMEHTVWRHDPAAARATYGL